MAATAVFQRRSLHPPCFVSCFPTSLPEFEVLRSTGCRCLSRTALRPTPCLFRSNQKKLRRSSRQEHLLQNVTLLLHVSCARLLALGTACEIDATQDCLLQLQKVPALADVATTCSIQTNEYEEAIVRISRTARPPWRLESELCALAVDWMQSTAPIGPGKLSPTYTPFCALPPACFRHG